MATNHMSSMTNPNAASGIRLRPELETVLDSLAEMPESELPRLLGELEEIRATAMLRMSSPRYQIPEHDERIDIDQAVERLGISRTYLYRHASEFPFTRREGRKLLFSSRSIDEYIRRKR
jgi:predicted DNA-binding transcriptional regulator AlpA